MLQSQKRSYREGHYCDTQADLHQLTGGNGTTEDMIIDSGCTKDIVAEGIVDDLGLKMDIMETPLNIVCAEGKSMKIVGTCIIYIKTQVTLSLRSHLIKGYKWIMQREGQTTF